MLRILTLFCLYFTTLPTQNQHITYKIQSSRHSPLISFLPQLTEHIFSSMTCINALSIKILSRKGEMTIPLTSFSSPVISCFKRLYSILTAQVFLYGRVTVSRLTNAGIYFFSGRRNQNRNLHFRSPLFACRNRNPQYTMFHFMKKKPDILPAVLPAKLVKCVYDSVFFHLLTSPSYGNRCNALKT